MKDRIFYFSCFGFLSGVLVRSLVSVNFYLAIWLVGISFLLIFFYTYLSRNKWGVIAGVFVLAFALGILRFHMVDQPAPEVFESQVGQSVSLTGMIVDDPDVRQDNQKLLVEDVEGDAKIRILVSASLGEDFKYGDEVKVEGKLTKPENFVTDQGKTFDYVNYLRKDGILYLINYGKIEIISHNNGNWLKAQLFSLKDAFMDKVNIAIPEPENLLMAGLILGEKSAFDQSLRQSFVDTGTIHIVALSGYNVTIVAEWFMKFLNLFKFLPQAFGISAGIVLIWLFVLMTGMSSTAIRAGIMATLALVARATGRNYDVARALILAGVFMIFLNPFVLVYDVSFQLSFIATVAVIFLAPRIEKYFMWITDKFELRDIVTVTSAAYIFVAPFILYEMGNLSFVALPANVLILPFIPFTMMLGFVTGFVGLIWYVLAVPLGYISYLFLHYELGVINFFSHLPFAAMTFPDFPLILTLAIYALFLYKLFGRNIYQFLTERF